MERTTTRLRQIMQRPGLIVAPACHKAIEDTIGLDDFYRIEERTVERPSAS